MWMCVMMDDVDVLCVKEDEDVWLDVDFVMGEGDARTSGEGASASETFKTLFMDDLVFVMVLCVEEDESVEMVLLVSVVVMMVKEKWMFVEASSEDV